MPSAEPRGATPARIFSALGDPTRLALVQRLGDGDARSLGQLCAGAGMTRQAVAKHLRVLEAAGLVHAARAGRESRYVLRPQPVAEARECLEAIAVHWEGALARLKAFVET